MNVVEYKDYTPPSPASLFDVVNSFIPQELIPKGWCWEDKDVMSNIQSLLDECKVHPALRMYGSSQQLCKYLHTFFHFPGAQDNVFHFPVTEGYNNNPYGYKSLKNQEYIYKHDYYYILMRAIYANTPLKPSENKLAMIIIASYLRKKERKLVKNNEMVPFTSQDIMALRKTVDVSLQIFAPYNAESAVSAHLKNGGNWKLLLDLWKSFFWSGEDNEKDEEDVRKVLEEYMIDFPIIGNQMAYSRIFMWSKMMTVHFERYINSNESLFLANQDVKVDQRIVTVRIFIDGQDKYIMAHELLETMKREKMDISGIDEEVRNMKKLETFNFRETFRKIGTQISKIQFVNVAIVRTKHAATPIPSYNGEGYCLLASDVLLDLLRDLIFAKQVFQKMNQSQWPIIEKFFESVDDFSPNQKVHFIQFEDIEKIKRKFNAYFKALDVFPRVATHVRDVKNGFTVEDLKEELEHLELTKAFPEISSDAQVVYEIVSRGKKMNDLKTSDMYDAIGICQVGWIFRMFPQIAQFLHNQNSCNIYPNFECHICTKKEEKPIEEASEDSELEKEEEVEEAEEVERGVGSVEEASDSSETQFKKQKRNKKSSAEKRKLKKQRKEEKALEVPSETPQEVESQCCLKCFRTNEICETSKAEAKSIKNKNKKLESQLAASERNRKMESEESQKKQTELEEENSALKKQLEECKKKIEEMEKIQMEQELSKINSKNQDQEETEIIDMECLICHDDMETTKGTMKCEICSRRYHDHCLQRWFLKSRVCPVCDHQFPDGI